MAENRENYPVVEESGKKTPEYVEFGQYLTAPGETGPIRWMVLDEDEEGILMITEKLIDLLPFQENLVRRKWKRCSLRRWLNGEFYKNAFSRAEKARILPYRQEAYDTEDKVFLCSRELFERYSAALSRAEEPTAYAVSKDENEDHETGYWWWVVSAAGTPAMAMPQTDPGTMYLFIDVGSYYVRPMIRIRKEA